MQSKDKSLEMKLAKVMTEMEQQKHCLLDWIDALQKKALDEHEQCGQVLEYCQIKQGQQTGKVIEGFHQKQ